MRGVYGYWDACVAVRLLPLLTTPSPPLSILPPPLFATPLVYVPHLCACTAAAQYERCCAAVHLSQLCWLHRHLDAVLPGCPWAARRCTLRQLLMTFPWCMRCWRPS